MEDNSTLIWIIVAAVVLIAIIAFFVMRSSGGDAKRHKAEEIRHEAAEGEREVRLREADAAKADAAARKVAAEADEQSAQAARLSAEADEQSAQAREMNEAARTRGQEAEGERAEHLDRLREADRIDPDVDTDKHGVRSDRGAPGGSTGAVAVAGAGAAGTDGAAGASHDEHRQAAHARDERGHERRRDEGLTGDRDQDGVPNAVDPSDGPVDRDGDGIDDREEKHWDRETRERENR